MKPGAGHDASQGQAELEYCPHLAEALKRRRDLFEHRPQDRIFAAIHVDRPSPTLDEFNRTHPEGECGYSDPGERVAFWTRLLREGMGVQDDSVPSAYLNEWDMGLTGALLGGKMRFYCHPWGRYSSNVAPFLNDWSEFDALKFDPRHPWFRKYLEHMRIFAAGAKGKFGIAPPCLINHLHLLFEMFGASRTYLELYDNPRRVRQAVDLAHELCRKIMDSFFENVPLVDGGTCLFWNEWVPGRIVMESVDAFHMTSVKCFEEWGRAAIERTFAAFDGGVLHIHGNGRHLLKAVSSIRGLKLIDLADDQPGVTPAFDMLPEIRAATGDVPLIVHAEFGGFCKALEAGRLAGGILYSVAGAPDADSANRCMEKVRAYSV